MAELLAVAQEHSVRATQARLEAEQSDLTTGFLRSRFKSAAPSARVLDGRVRFQAEARQRLQERLAALRDLAAS